MAARPQWKRDLDRVAKKKSIGIHVADGGRVIYSRAAKAKRIPASNQKLLMTMALLDRIDAGERLVTTAMGRAVEGRVLEGNLFVVGRGDPSLTSGGAFARGLTFEPTGLGVLARKIKRSGVRKIAGRVVGVRSYFAHDWWADGWKSSFPSTYVPLAAALNVNANVHKGRHISNPEKRLAQALTKKLKKRGVRVARKPKVGGMPAKGKRKIIARVESAPLRAMLRYMNHKSSNFFAEAFGKLLGILRSGPQGTIRKGARAVRAFARGHGVAADAHDSSGLSYANRISPKGLARLLGWAESQPWGNEFRAMLPSGGEGTLEGRLGGVPVRAKTGTLQSISTLSGWIRLKKTGSWAEFSIMSSGMSKSKAVTAENRIVRILRRRARPPRTALAGTTTLSPWPGVRLSFGNRQSLPWPAGLWLLAPG